jgi:AAA+ ATPase superfamily predicted ATPase
MLAFNLERIVMFSASVPVTARAFFDRGQERERILQSIAQLQAGNPRWLCLVGPRKVGKTSLLLEVARELRGLSQERVGFVVADVLDTMPVSQEFFRTLALQTVDMAWSTETGTSLRALARDPVAYRSALSGTPAFTKLPSEVRSFLLELPVSPAGDTAFVRSCLELPERLAVALDRHFVVAIDEFQELAGLASNRKAGDPLPLMRSVWQRHTRVGYIVSGSARSLLVELATSEHSPFFQHFALMDVGAFAEADAIELLVQASADRAPIGEALARQVFRTVGGHPFYLQVIGEAMADKACGAVDERTLKESIQQELFSRTGRLALYFANEYQRIVGRATTLAATLDGLAQGPRRLTDVAQTIGAPTGATLNYLERLGDAVMRTDEGLHTLTDPVFGLWLRWRQPGGTVLPMTLVGDDGERAAATHLGGLGFELVYQSRGSRGAFDLLATRGSIQLGVQVKRKALPLRFSKAEWNRMEADAQRYGWLWAVAAVDADGHVSLLDPARAKAGTAMTLDERAVIDNLLRWLDTASEPVRARRPRPRKR